MLFLGMQFITGIKLLMAFFFIAGLGLKLESGFSYSFVQWEICPGVCILN